MAAYRYILTHLISCIAAVGVHLPGRPAAIDLHGAQPDDSRARHSTISVHFAAAVCTLLFPTYLVASNIAAFERPGVQQFVREMATKHGFDKRGLTSVLRRAVIRQDIVEAISRPARREEAMVSVSSHFREPRTDRGWYSVLEPARGDSRAGA